MVVCWWGEGYDSILYEELMCSLEAMELSGFCCCCFWDQWKWSSFFFEFWPDCGEPRKLELVCMRTWDRWSFFTGWIFIGWQYDLTFFKWLTKLPYLTRVPVYVFKSTRCKCNKRKHQGVFCNLSNDLLV